MDPTKLAKDMLQAVKDYVAEASASLSARFDAIEKRIAEIPAGRDGANGKDGADGKNGLDGINGKDADPGRDGKDGAPGRDGIDGKDGAAGRDGIDGKSVTLEDVQPLLETIFAKSLLDYERRFGEAIAKSIAAVRQPKDGADGLSIEDLDVAHDGLGNVKFTFSRGDVKREFHLRVPCFKDRGVFRDGEEYREGDGVTFGGSFWLAQRDAPEGRPGDGAAAGERGKGNGHWRLAVNKGRDGRRESTQPPTGPVKL